MPIPFHDLPALVERVLEEKSKRTSPLFPPPMQFPEPEPVSERLSREDRLMGLFKAWVILRHFSPFSNLTDWDAFLYEWIPKVEIAQDLKEYYQIFEKLTAQLHGIHVQVRHRMSDKTAVLPIRLKYAEGRMVVGGIKGEPEILLGDEIVSINEAPFGLVEKQWRKRISASSDQAFRRDFLRQVVIGEKGEHLKLSVRSSGRIREIRLPFLEPPSGLILADIMDGQTAEVLSVFVGKAFMNQGISKALMARLEEELTRRGCTGVFGIYTANKPFASGLERLLEKCEWNQPKPRQLVCTSKGEDVERMMKSDWMNHYRLPKSFDIFPWADIITEELEKIRGWPDDPPYYHDGLSPFLKDGADFEPVNSLGLSYRGEIAGRMITTRVVRDTVRYERLFVKKEFQRMGRAIPLLTESIRRQYAHEGHIPTKGGIWIIQADSMPMVQFIRKRMEPYLTSLIETKQSFKSLQ